MSRIGLETSLAALGMRTVTDLERIAAEVNVDRLANSPRRLTPEALLALLRSIR